MQRVFLTRLVTPTLLSFKLAGLLLRQPGLSSERLLFSPEPLRRVRSLARLLIAFSRDSIIDALLPELVWRNTHDARGDCGQPNYIVIIIQTEIILTFCCTSLPAVTFGSYPRSTPVPQLLFRRSPTKSRAGLRSVSMLLTH